MISKKVVYLFLLIPAFVLAQRKAIKGQLVASGDVEGIHILNKNALKYTVSAANGSFEILVKDKDTLSISGLKYNTKTVVVSFSMIEENFISVLLTEKINELDEVLLGTWLSGNLESDLDNTNIEPQLNFYDLGIPGYTGKPLTINQRKLFDANGGPPVVSFGTGNGVNFHKLLNLISGRTKKLKTIVALDNKKQCLKRIRREYESVILENEAIPQQQVNAFFIFVMKILSL